MQGLRRGLGFNIGHGRRPGLRRAEREGAPLSWPVGGATPLELELGPGRDAVNLTTPSAPESIRAGRAAPGAIRASCFRWLATRQGVSQRRSK